MALNVKLGMGKKQRELERIIREQHNPSTARLSREILSRNIANEITGLYAQRAQRQKLTGHWIVYARHDEQNYYLCLAMHDEGDEPIFDRIKDGCPHQFSFLQAHLNVPAN